MLSKLRHLLLILLVAGTVACKDKKSVQAEAEVVPGPIADPAGYSKRQAQQGDIIDPGKVQPPITDPNTDKPPPIAEPKLEQVNNPIHENPILTQVFQTYLDAGIDDPKMDGMLDQLKEEDLTVEDMKSIMDQFNRIVMNSNEALLEKLPLEERMKLAFNLYASNEKAAEFIQSQLISADLLEGFSSEEKKNLAPYIYASTIYENIKKVNPPRMEVYTSKNAVDGKNYRTIFFGRIDFSKGVKKKNLDKKDLEIIDAVAAVQNSLLHSKYRISSVGIQITGHADRDKASNADKNMQIGLSRAQMVLDAYEKNEPSKTSKAVSMGDAYPMENLDPKDPKNRRVEFVISHREITVMPMGKLPPPHEHEEGDDHHQDS